MPKAVQLQLAGKTWSAMWWFDGKTVDVGSAYGSAKGPCGRRQPKRVAEDLFRQVLASWCGATGC